jgi:hypothetical protein
VARTVVAARARVLQPFSQGEKLDGEEGSLTRLSEKIFLQRLVEQHNQGGKHLELHQPVCVGHQFKDGVVLGCYWTPMLLSHAARGINSGWPFLAGFDTTLGSPARNSNQWVSLSIHCDTGLIPFVFALSKMKRP